MPIPALKRIATMSARVFGQPAIRIDTADNRSAVRVIFSEEHADMDANGVQVSERRPTAWIEESVGLDSRDLIEIEGTTYYVDHMQADGYGLVRLELMVHVS